MKTIKLFFAFFILLSCIAAIHPPAEQENSLFTNSNENLLFEEFIAEFDRVELPFAITAEELIKEIDSDRNHQKIDSKRIAKNHEFSKKYQDVLPELRHAMFSRMGPNVVEPMVAFKIHENKIGVIYSSLHPFGFDKSYQLALFGKNGNTINNYFIAHSSFSSITSCEINKDFMVAKQHFDVEWSKDIDEVGISDNHVVQLNNIDNEYFRINNNGAFEQINNIPKTAKASLY